MGERQTGAEARQQYIDLMGQELGVAYDTLRNDVTLAFAHRALYRELYSDTERLQVLNDVAGTLFYVLQRMLLWDVLLELARLVDSPQTGRKKNLTLHSLPSLIPDPALRTRVDQRLATSTSACSDAVIWRHRRIAHRDLAVATNPDNTHLPEIPFARIDAALVSCADLLNELESHYNNGATVEYAMIGRSVRADGLFYFLEKGLDSERNGRGL